MTEVKDTVRLPGGGQSRADVRRPDVGEISGVLWRLGSAWTERAGDPEQVDVEAVVRRFARHLRLLPWVVSFQYETPVKGK
ncbi:hypothetical protein GCM10010522_13040 [Kribbella solani]